MNDDLPEEPSADLPEEDEHLLHPPVRDHLDRDEIDECGYCGQSFGPEDVVIEKTIYGRKYRFCSEDCYRDFMDASNFKDQNLDADRDHLHAKAELEEDGDDEF